jgi:anti-sigma regulatory factor (Ser/Thr protein kinase)
VEENGVTMIREAPQRLCLPPRVESGSSMRQAVGFALSELGAGNEETADLLLAASEALNNAISHGSMTPDDQLWLGIETTDCELVVTFEYRGEPFAIAPPTLPGTTSANGRGRYLMDLLTDGVSYEFHDHWTRAELRKQIRGR